MFPYSAPTDPCFQPADLVKQSFPFSYMSVTATPTDGAGHSVQVYSDISAEWVTGNVSFLANWTTSTDNLILTHQIQLSSQHPFAEDHDQIQRQSIPVELLTVAHAETIDGSVYFSTPHVCSAICLTLQCADGLFSSPQLSHTKPEQISKSATSSPPTPC